MLNSLSLVYFPLLKGVSLGHITWRKITTQNNVYPPLDKKLIQLGRKWQTLSTLFGYNATMLLNGFITLEQSHLWIYTLSLINSKSVPTSAQCVFTSTKQLSDIPCVEKHFLIKLVR